MNNSLALRAPNKKKRTPLNSNFTVGQILYGINHENSPLRLPARKFFEAFLKNADKTEEWDCTNKVLSEKIGVSIATIERIVRKAEKYRFLTREIHCFRLPGKTHPEKYRTIKIDWDALYHFLNNITDPLKMRDLKNCTKNKSSSSVLDSVLDLDTKYNRTVEPSAPQEAPSGPHHESKFKEEEVEMSLEEKEENEKPLVEKEENEKPLVEKEENEKPLGRKVIDFKTRCESFRKKVIPPIIPLVEKKETPGVLVELKERMIAHGMYATFDVVEANQARILRVAQEEDERQKQRLARACRHIIESRLPELNLPSLDVLYGPVAPKAKESERIVSRSLNESDEGEFDKRAFRLEKINRIPEFYPNWEEVLRLEQCTLEEIQERMRLNDQYNPFVDPNQWWVSECHSDYALMSPEERDREFIRLVQFWMGVPLDYLSKRLETMFRNTRKRADEIRAHYFRYLAAQYDSFGANEIIYEKLCCKCGQEIYLRWEDEGGTIPENRGAMKLIQRNNVRKWDRLNSERRRRVPVDLKKQIEMDAPMIEYHIKNGY